MNVGDFVLIFHNVLTVLSNWSRKRDNHLWVGLQYHTLKLVVTYISQQRKPQNRFVPVN